MKIVGATKSNTPIKPIVKPIEDELVGGDINKIMQSVIDDKDKIEAQKDDSSIVVEIRFTPKQFDRWNARGGERWLKKELYGRKK